MGKFWAWQDILWLVFRCDHCKHTDLVETDDNDKGIAETAAGVWRHLCEEWWNSQ